MRYRLQVFTIWDGNYGSDGITKHKIQLDASQANLLIFAPIDMKFNDVYILIPAKACRG